MSNTKNRYVYNPALAEVTRADAIVSEHARRCADKLLLDWSRRGHITAYQDDEHYQRVASAYYQEACAKAGVRESNYFCALFERVVHAKFQDIAAEKGRAPVVDHSLSKPVLIAV